MKFAFRSGVKKFKGLDPVTAARELEEIREREGNLRAEAVVDEARSESSHLHSAFTWDDSKAAEAHRLWEARALIKELIIIDEKTDESEPAFLNVRFQATDDTQADRYYQSAAVLLRSPQEMDSALAESRAKLTSAENSFKAAARLARRVKQPAGRVRKIESVARRIGKTQAQAARL